MKKIYSKYIFRMLTAFVVWSAIYAIVDDNGIASMVGSFLKGHIHLWFIFMIVGLYMCLPFIRPIAANENIMKYYFILSLIFCYVIPETLMIMNDFGNETVLKFAGVISYDATQIGMEMVLGFASYFLLGFYVAKTEITKKQRIIIYVLGVIGAVSTVALSSAASLHANRGIGQYFSGNTLNVLFMSLAVFVFFKYRKYSNPALNNVFKTLSKYSFGAYLVHLLILEQLDSRLGINSLMGNPIITVILLSVLFFVAAMIVSAILNHIPFLNKYIV